MRYPEYILFRSSVGDCEPEFIVKVESEFENSGMDLPSDMFYYRDQGLFSYRPKNISQAEAETYQVMGVVPMMSVVQFTKHFVKFFNKEHGQCQ